MGGRQEKAGRVLSLWALRSCSEQSSRYARGRGSHESMDVVKDLWSAFGLPQLYGRKKPRRTTYLLKRDFQRNTGLSAAILTVRSSSRSTICGQGETN